MSLETWLKKAEWILTGTAEGGQCPECDRFTIVIEEDSYRCESCDFDGEMPEAPGW